MSQNPVKFVKIFNTKGGSQQVIPLITWEQLSSQPKALKTLEFMYSCDEDGNRTEQPAILIEKLDSIETVIKNKTNGKK